MKRNLRTITIVTALLSVLIMAVSCSQEEIVEQQEKGVSVEVATVGLASETIVRTFTGSVEGERHADIYAKIAEAVDKVNVTEGDRVKAGEVLMTLDKSGPSSSYRNAESVFLNAEKSYKRMEYLFSEGAVSETQFDAARTEYEVARANFESAAKLVEIEAPVDGVVTSINISRGDYLKAGQKLATVASVDRLRVKFGVGARDIAMVKTGAPVSVSSDEIAGSVEGRIVAVARSADPQTRSFQVEVLFDNPSGAFRPGIFVRVSLVIDELTDVIVIPRDAIITLEGQSIVFVVQDGKAVLRPVTLAEELSGRVVIKSGLEAGDTLVTLGQNYLDDGFAVNVVAVEKAGQ